MTYPSPVTLKTICRWTFGDVQFFERLALGIHAHLRCNKKCPSLLMSNQIFHTEFRLTINARPYLLVSTFRSIVHHSLTNHIGLFEYRGAKTKPDGLIDY